MGSQTLEILRQGVWASLTGGWFYDPHQDVFCNTFHLYIWLFLLCLPFTIYVYFPPTKYLWYMYCGSVALVLTVIKLVNYGLHHMYDTTDCVEEVIKYDWQGQKREDEGIELQILSKSTENTRPSRPPMIRNLSFAGVSPTTDGDSIESIDFPQNTGNNPTTTKPSSTIDLKAEVHRKNSSESSEESARAVETVAQDLEATERDVKKAEKTLKHQRSQTEGLVRFTFKDETLTPSVRFSKRPDSGDLQEQIHMQFVDRDCLHLPPYIHDIGRRRHSNFTNGSLNLLPVNERSDIRPTGSLELEYIDQNPHQYLATEGFSFKPHPRNDSGVRRIRSTVLASHVFTPLIAHRNSLEIIGCKSAKNPLPPPSTSLTRNHHLNLCTYYGSEIVYPIEELSAEHQTSHDADDLDSISRISDSDLEDTNQGSNSPLIYSNMKDVCSGINQLKVGEEEKASATSKDILLDNDDSNSSANSNSEMQDARTECYHAVDASSDKKLGECSNMACSSASVEFEERTDRKQAAVVKHMPIEKWDENSTVNKNLTKVESDYKLCDVECDGGQPGILRKRNARRHKKKKVSINARKSENVEAARCCSSLVELDLDWLFDDEGGHLPHRKEPLKSDSDWLGTTTVSLEHDVSKVLQEPVPSTRSLGAIPKKTRGSSSHIDHHQTDRKTPKSESEKCSMCRCKTDGQPSDERSSTRSRSSKENKVTQTLKRSDSFSPVEAVDFLKVERPEQHSHMGPSLNRSKRGTTFKKMARHQIEEPSSGGSNNELSTLLPAAPLLSVFLNSRREFPRPSCIREGDCYLLDYAQPHPHHRSRLKRGRCNRRRSNQVVKRESAIASSISAGYGTHSAKNFNDTSDGSIHCFMDEYGNWMTYTFDEKGIGTANETRTANNVPQTSFSYQNDQAGRTAIKDRNVKREFLESNSTESICDSSISTIIDAKLKSRVHSNPNSANTLFPQMHHSSLPDNIPAMRRRSRRITTGQSLDLVNNTDDSMISVVRGENENNDEDTRNKFYKVIQALYNNSNFPRTKTYYMYKVLPWTIIKVTLDRLKLLALLDRNLTISETMLSIFLGILVSVLGAILLYCNFYNDVLAFVFCFIMASCQYSLLKSVQPDAASPTHGFNRVIAYSRPIYFCIVSIIVIILHINLDPSTIDADYIFTETDTSNQQILLYTRDFLIMFILFFPILFSLGLFPQINTFIMYLLEQVDMHVFGGNAMSNLLASFYCIFRSILAVIVMNGLAYGGLSEPKSSQHILFSMFCACLVACSYHLSRSASDPSHIWNIMKKHLWPPEIYREHVKTLDEIKVSGKETTVSSKTNKTNDSDKEKDGSNLGKNVKFPSEVKETKPPDEHVDPLPHKLQKTVNGRLKNDVILCSLIALVVFGIHTSTVFTVLQPELGPVLWSITASMGFILHYVIPQMRKQLPWLCIARPILRSHEFDQYQARAPAKIMWFERIYVYFCFLERNLLYPLLFLAALTEDAPKIALKYGVVGGSFLVVICGLKCLRSSYSEQNSQYLILTFTALFFKFDYSFSDETFLLEYFFMSIAFHKFSELLLKIQFVVTYIAPWQITWGSAFHAFAQPFSVPHSAMLFLQAFISATLSTPLNPFLGSAIFLTSYVRPVKFWERDYNTRRVDHSNTPLSSHLDRNLGADDNNLNSIFYEHLTRSLQHSLCGDLALGRWGPVNQGDCFVLASDYLNCLIHIIEMGNGLVTFQMRGLEFRGTYCQQREVEAITEDVEENYGCCCCDTGHLPNMLSVNAAFSQRWLAWEVTAAKYILEGYSISDNNAVSMLQVFDFRKYLISFYVKSIIFYTIRSPKLLEWLSCQTILKALQPMEHRNFVDLDPVFNYNIDEDYDHQNSGMTRNVFIQVHGDWLNYCVEKSDKDIDAELNASLVLLCFALSLLGRRALGAVSHSSGPNVEFFLYGLHALFKGDFRITCARDEWVFTDMDLLKTVVAPAVRMSLKLHQDHFMTPDEYEDLSVLYNAICDHEEELVISHEGDPAWRNAVLSGTSSLLALRRVMDEGQDEYKIIMLNKRYLTFRVIKVNKECVRGLWAGQQQELVYLRNRNPERGSIQNAKQALRNIINSSCDQPIGYPIYVSPLTTSYAETNEQFKSLLGGSLTLKKIKNYVFNTFRRIRKRCGEGCSSGASNREEIGMGHEGVYAMTPITALGHHTTGSQSMDGSHLGGSMGRGSSLSRTSLGGNRGSLISMGKPTSSTLASLAGLFKEKDERAVSQAPDAQARGDERLGDATDVHERDLISSRVRILDPNLVYDGINLGRRIDVCWPTEYMRMRGGRSHWKDWVPEAGMEGPVVHKWTPCNKDPNKRSHVDRTILLIQIEDKYVPIAESGVQDLGPEV